MYYELDRVQVQVLLVVHSVEPILKKLWHWMILNFKLFIIIWPVPIQDWETLPRYVYNVHGMACLATSILSYFLSYFIHDI